MPDRRRSALHEAAHALALLKAGEPGRGIVDVRLFGEGGGHVVWLPHPFGTSPDVAAKACVVGVISELLLGELDAQGRERAFRRASSDLGKALAYMKDKAAAAAVINWAVAWTRKHEMEIEAIAQELDRKGRLSRAEVMLIAGIHELDDVRCVR